MSATVSIGYECASVCDCEYVSVCDSVSVCNSECVHASVCNYECVHAAVCVCICFANGGILFNANCSLHSTAAYTL